MPIKQLFPQPLRQHTDPFPPPTLPPSTSTTSLTLRFYRLCGREAGQEEGMLFAAAAKRCALSMAVWLTSEPPRPAGGSGGRSFTAAAATAGAACARAPVGAAAALLLPVLMSSPSLTLEEPMDATAHWPSFCITKRARAGTAGADGGDARSGSLAEAAGATFLFAEGRESFPAGAALAAPAGDKDDDARCGVERLPATPTTPPPLPPALPGEEAAEDDDDDRAAVAAAG
jgi:hypothetical protein